MKGHGQKGWSGLRSTKTKKPTSELTAETDSDNSRPTQAPKRYMYSSKYFQLKRRETQPHLPIKQGNSPRNQAKTTNTQWF
jgi:hypothetical protein